MTKDPVLAAVLAEISAQPGAPAKEATLVRDLAVEGARQRLAADRRGPRAAADFIELSMTLDGIDRDVLLNVKGAAWTAST
ncbi:MAG TPA: hypothetical protein VE777_04700 [Gaiellales bacterium]|nr:hypothetical protein [Gaiellales bacterium]